MVHAELVDRILVMHPLVLVKSPVHLWLTIREDSVNSVADISPLEFTDSILGNVCVWCVIIDNYSVNDGVESSLAASKRETSKVDSHCAKGCWQWDLYNKL